MYGHGVYTRLLPDEHYKQNRELPKSKDLQPKHERSGDRSHAGTLNIKVSPLCACLSLGSGTFILAYCPHEDSTQCLFTCKDVHFGPTVRAYLCIGVLNSLSYITLNGFLFVSGLLSLATDRSIVLIGLAHAKKEGLSSMVGKDKEG